MAMTKITFEFNLKKAVEALLYIANRVEHPTFMSVAKLLYFADKTSLELYGRFIAGDSYFAMEHGPVPTNTYNLMKAGHDGDQYGFSAEQHNIKPLREANTDWLSDSDIACLDKVIEAYGHLPTWDIRSKSHDEAWEQTWREAAQNKQGSAPIPVERIVHLFDESDEILDYLQHRNND
jgi:uncharacterized phage-associated protein